MGWEAANDVGVFFRARVFAGMRMAHDVLSVSRSVVFYPSTDRVTQGRRE